MKVLITGAGGQVGRALVTQAPTAVDIRAVQRGELDIADADGVARYIAAFRPDVIINAAAYTAVDKAESDESGAARGNVEGPRNLAAAARDVGARLLHISTDFVFDGQSATPYRPDDAVNPLGVYGRTKLAGERAVLEILCERAAIVRTAWVYAAQGNNFLRTMLRLMSEHGAVRVVTDQIGTPTAALSLADVLWMLALRSDLSGTYHWSDAGVASWYDFAVAIAEEAHLRGLLPGGVQVMPIATHEYPTPASRPHYSVLDKAAIYTALQLTPVHWRQNLRAVLDQL